MTDFYDHPDLYDALFPAGAHASFYADLARQQKGAVLELACGTGQLVIPIALQGLSTVGLDRSHAMLTVAKGRASEAGASLALLQSDMRDFALRRKFKLIFVARNSLLHLLSNDDVLACFASVRAHLARDGLFAFDVFNPDLTRYAGGAPGQRFPVMEINTPRFGTVRVEETRDYDAASQVNHATWYISASGQQEAWAVPLVLKSIFPDELLSLLSAAGLDLIGRFGELSGDAFSLASRVQVCLCRRRA